MCRVRVERSTLAAHQRWATTEERLDINNIRDEWFTNAQIIFPDRAWLRTALALNARAVVVAVSRDEWDRTIGANQKSTQNIEVMQAEHPLVPQMDAVCHELGITVVSGIVQHVLSSALALLVSALAM